LLGFSQIANGLEVSFFVDVTTFQTKCGPLRQRAEKPNQVWSDCNDEADAGGERNYTAERFVGEGRAVFQPGAACAAEQNGEQEHLGGAKKAQLMRQGGKEPKNDSNDQEVEIDCWTHNYLHAIEAMVPTKWTCSAAEILADWVKQNT
jgi:hypothetical protein